MAGGPAAGQDWSVAEGGVLDGGGAVEPAGMYGQEPHEFEPVSVRVLWLDSEPIGGTSGACACLALPVKTTSQGAQVALGHAGKSHADGEGWLRVWDESGQHRAKG